GREQQCSRLRYERDLRSKRDREQLRGRAGVVHDRPQLQRSRGGYVPLPAPRRQCRFHVGLQHQAGGRDGRSGYAVSSATAGGKSPPQLKTPSCYRRGRTEAPASQAVLTARWGEWRSTQGDVQCVLGQRGRPAGDTVAEAGRRSRLAPRSEGRAQGMNGRISGAAVSFTNASSTTHVSEITRPPGGSLPSGPLPMVASPVFATSSDPRPSNATANGPSTGTSSIMFSSELGNLSASLPSGRSIESCCFEKSAT